MKKQETDSIVEEIKEKKRIPKEVKEKMNQVVFKNVALGIIIVLYFIFINLGYHNITKDVFVVDIKVFSMCLAIIAIVLFEKSYCKNSGELAVYGIEILLAALATLFMQYVYFYQGDTFIKLYMLIPLVFAIYYVSKAAILAAKIQDTHRRNISDVKEIIKKEKKPNIEEPTEDKDAIAQKNVITKKEKQGKVEKTSAKKRTTSKTTAQKASTKKTITNKATNTTTKGAGKTTTKKRRKKAKRKNYQ